MTIQETSDHTLPIHQLVAVFLLAIGGYIAIGPIIGILVLLPFFNFDIELIMNMIAAPELYPYSRIVILIYQGFAQLTGFIFIPFFYFRHLKINFISYAFRSIKNSSQALPIAFFITVVFMWVNAPIIEWNENIQFPEFMSSFESWARQLEEGTQAILEHLVKFNGPSEFFLGLLVVAVIPAIGEEIVFRGIIQKQLGHYFKHPVLAIWIAAILFSAIHLQFYGFVPRMLLGALFGYLFYWTGNLGFAILGHFVQNGLTLTLSYLYQQKIIDYNIENPEAEISWLSISVALLVFVLLIYYFRKFVKS
jgi:hypothetical protein